VTLNSYAFSGAFRAGNPTIGLFQDAENLGQLVSTTTIKY
jgi:hypothetical protein